MITLKETSNILRKFCTTNDEFVLLNLIERLTIYFPEVTSEIEGIILDCDSQDITKVIRQTSDSAEAMLFYDILNGDFGYKVIKVMKGYKYDN